MSGRKEEYCEPQPAFAVWTSGSDMQAAEPDPPTPEEAKPFHVMLRGDHHIPCSVLVFARDEEHAKQRAKQRVLEALREAHRLSYRKERGRAAEFLDDLQTGDLTLHVAPYDVAWIRAKVVWAMNGGVL